MRKDGHSLRQLAKVFRVDKRTVQFVCDPEKLEACKDARARRGGSKRYYDIRKNTMAQRDHRKHKEKVFRDLGIDLHGYAPRGGSPRTVVNDGSSPSVSATNTKAHG